MSAVAMQLHHGDLQLLSSLAVEQVWHELPHDSAEARQHELARPYAVSLQHSSSGFQECEALAAGTPLRILPEQPALNLGPLIRLLHCAHQHNYGVCR
jgi:hypothetical protein